jgi:ubiquinone/menaquinone biosynthesis C-methylase UbiE
VAAWKQKRTVMHQYDTTAPIYEERYSEEQKSKYRKALEHVDVAGMGVLDDGCGSGLFFSEVAAHADFVVGVDVSRGLLKKANQRAKAFENVSVVRADADYLPFSSGCFGAVFAFTVLQNMPKPAVTLGEIKRVAVSGGWVVVTGLKKAFALDKFMDLLEGSRLKLIAFCDEATVNCYVAVLSV